MNLANAWESMLTCPCSSTGQEVQNSNNNIITITGDLQFQIHMYMEIYGYMYIMISPCIYAKYYMYMYYNFYMYSYMYGGGYICTWDSQISVVMGQMLLAYPKDGATLVTVPVNRWTSAGRVFLPEINTQINNNNHYGLIRVLSHVYCTYMYMHINVPALSFNFQLYNLALHQGLDYPY